MGMFGKPLQVVWTADNPDHKVHKDSMIFSKSIHHEYLLLYVRAPKFEADKTTLFFSVSNRNEKALGFGVPGIALRTDNEERNCLNLAASTPVALSRRGGYAPTKDTNGKTVMVDAEEDAEFEAVFAAIPPPSRIGVAIEAKRILARNFLFVVVFEFDQ